MASRFASVIWEQILSINEAVVPNNTKMATKFGLTVFNGKLFNLFKLQFFRQEKATIPCLHEVSSSTKV